MFNALKTRSVHTLLVATLNLPGLALAQTPTVSVPTVPGAPSAATSAFGGATPAAGRAGAAQAAPAADYGATPQLAMPPSNPAPSLNRPQANTGARPGAEAADATDAAQPEAKSVDQSQRITRRERVTEFQKFVFETSGQALPLFGYGFFGGERFAASQNAPVPADYVIGPGDEIQLHVWGAVDADLRLTVDRNGQITVPKAGTFVIAGVRAAQLEGVLREQIGRVFRNFQLNASMGPLRSIQIFVVGQANRPGTYMVSGNATLITALFDSGGPSATGSLRNIQVKRAGKLASTIDLYRFIALGEKDADIKLLAGDVIVIPPAGPRVAILGAVDTPAIYELKSPQETLAELLSYGGGTLSLTSPQKVIVERIDPAAAGAQRTVEDRALNAAGLQSTVRDGDVVTLFKISPQFANAVTLRGNVAAPLRYPYRPGMRISDLIPEREALIRPEYYQSKNAMVQFETGTKISDTRVAREVRNLLEEVNWDYALVERLDAKAVKSTLIPFNLGRAVLNHDPRDDLLLLPGDVVTVFGVSDVPVPIEKRTQFVKLGGEVKVPGLYQITPGEKLPQLVQRAGGLTSNAFVYGTEFLREATRRQQQANLDLAVRSFEAEAAGATATVLQNTQDGDKSNSVQAQVASQQLLLSRLKALKASGRIALDLDPIQPVLPDLPLEDGDAITVPHPPSFIGVFGAVLAERSFIQRDSYTVGDYLKRAGLTRSADQDALMIIRADGTIESDAQRANAVFSFGPGLMDRKVFAGDSIFIPEKLDRETGYSKFIRGAKDWTAIFYQFGLGAAAIKTFRL